MYKHKWKFLFIIFSFWSGNSFSQPPYLTESPVPLDYLETDFYFYSLVDRGINSISVNEETGEIEGTSSSFLSFPSIDLEYGLTSDITLHLTIPFENNLVKHNATYSGVGDIETGFLYRFIKEDDWWPEIGFFPLFEFPTGHTNKNLGNGRFWYQLPLVIKKTFIDLDLELTADFGRAINHASQMKDYWFGSFLLERKINEKLKLGVELYSQGATSIGRHAYTLLNITSWYDLTPNFAIYASIGNQLIGERHLIGSLGVFWKFEGQKK